MKNRFRSLLPFLVLPALLAVLPASAEPPPQVAARSAETVPEGLSAGDWSSIRAAYEAGRHAFEPTDGGWRARNPGQRWTTRFDGRGFLATPDEGGWSWGLELRSYGIGRGQQAVGAADVVIAEGRRLAYRRGGLEEWWVNDGRGLEHGFVVSERPAGGRAGDPLAFHLATVGGLSPRVSPDGLGVAFEAADGAEALTYGGLKVWDAEGRTLPSRFEEGGGEMLRLLVDDRGAVYPVTIDPVAQQAYLKAGNAELGDHFGSSVAISGDTVVVGAPYESSSQTSVTNGPGGSADNSALRSGAAYVFVRSGTSWSQQAYLKAGNAWEGDEFGCSVAISGDTVVVAAWDEDSSQTGVTNGPGGSADDSAPASGAAYVFVRSGTSWSQQAYLKAGNTREEDSFGTSLAIAGDTLVVGASLEDSSQTGVTNGPGGSADDSAEYSGAAYVFVRSGASWSQQAYLKAGNTGATDVFGESVDISGDTVVVGANREASSQTGVTNGPGGSADDSAWSSGAAYVFVRSGTSWSQQAYLKAGNTGEEGEEDLFGDMAISGDTVVVGAAGEDSSETGVTNGPGGPIDNNAPNSGAAYVFVRSGTSWSQQAYLKAGNTGAGDEFGASVAISGDTLVVGAYKESSDQIGVTNGPGGSADDSFFWSGAAYVFVRSGTSWSQQAYLKPGNTGDLTLFGLSVDIWGDTVVVGSLGEPSSETGVTNGPGGAVDNNAPASGAAYVFLVDPPAAVTLSVNPVSQVVPTAGGSHSFEVSASGNWSWSVDGGSGWFSSGEALNQSGNQTFGYTIAANSNGSSRVATITLISGELSVTHTVTQAGTDPEPGISLTGDGDFGLVETGRTATRTLSISNPGTAALNLAAIDYPPGFSGSWSGATIAAGGSVQLTVTFAPTLVQVYGGEVVVSSDAAFGIATLTVSGTGQPPSPPGISVQKPKTFPTLRLRKSARQTVRITNAGGSPLTGLGAVVGGKGARDFRAAAPVQRTLAPNASTDVTVTFRPLRKGVRDATLTIVGNASPVTVKISGRGK